MSKQIEAMVTGHKKFRKTYYQTPNPDFAALIQQGQKPKVLMIACCDSRVDPALIMDCQPGDLFVVRNVANLVPPNQPDNHYHGTSAALEFAVKGLEVEEIVILGHAHCGGIKALVEKQNNVVTGDTDYIEKWMQIAQPAFEKVSKTHKKKPLDEQAKLCEQYSLINSHQNLLSFPWVKSRVEAGTLNLHAWYFDLTDGMIYAYDEPAKSFKAIS